MLVGLWAAGGGDAARLCRVGRVGEGDHRQHRRDELRDGFASLATLRRAPGLGNCTAAAVDVLEQLVHVVRAHVGNDGQRLVFVVGRGGRAGRASTGARVRRISRLFLYVALHYTHICVGT